MKIITIEEMRAFILAQPDDKPIDMWRSCVKDGECVEDDEYVEGDEYVNACLMLQYAKDELGLSPSTSGTIHTYEESSIKPVSELNFIMDDLIQGGFENKSHNFGELKKSLL